MIKNNKGFTIAEGLVAMVLLAIVTVGIFSAVLSSVRATKAPDVKEDLAFAVSAANAQIKRAWGNAGSAQNTLICGSVFNANGGDLSCFLPTSCSIQAGSTMTYTYTTATRAIDINLDCRRRQ